jgi:anti-repressor protein
MNNLELYTNFNGLEIYKTEKNNQAIWGRDLKESLNVSEKTDYTHWINSNLNAVDAKENIDYKKLVFKSDLSKTGQTQQNHLLTINIAKHICMVVGAMPRASKQLKEKSKMFRQYFIDLEKELLKLKQQKEKEKLLFDNFDFLSDDVKKGIAVDLFNKFNEIKPYANKYKSFMESDGTFTPTSIAKIFGETARELNKILEKQKIQFKQGKSWYLTDGMDTELVKYIIHPYGTQMKWTPKGFNYLIDVLESLGYQPVYANSFGRVPKEFQINA